MGQHAEELTLTMERLNFPQGCSGDVTVLLRKCGGASVAAAVGCN